ncbi:hypothetical protein NDU88_007179 [Pleurodeles waltl]|uniref:Reverse transcriptase domain-containing protein n=1 Tax=Pleurodeles waltl TaxID=8319 RepID=A0AAV7QJY5_PLEWA|nr:hypothetical protein NDU88_007179 [Pleurodeles waltl]
MAIGSYPSRAQGCLHHSSLQEKGKQTTTEKSFSWSLLAKSLPESSSTTSINTWKMDTCPKSQCSFREGRGKVDMIFEAHQLQEKCQEQNMDLYTTIVDLTKAFDSISHEGLWRIMEKFSCPGKFIRMEHQFHNGMLARVLDDGDSSDAFPVTNGVKQGCVLAPMLSSMMFSAKLSDAFCNDEETSIKIRYRTDGRLFSLRRIQAKTKG